METPLNSCPECHAQREAGTTCQDDFHQMMFWEAEKPSLGVVHHLMVLCYHLQHPSMYSLDGLNNAKTLLIDFVARGLAPHIVRQQNRHHVDAGNRQWKITARPGMEGAYTYPVTWTMTARDVVAGGMDHYIENVNAWAQSVLESLKVTN